MALSRAKPASAEEWQRIIDRTINRIDVVIEQLEQVPRDIGKLGGQKTAERGPEYFRQIAAMRKTRSGGRPRKEVTVAKT